MNNILDNFIWNGMNSGNKDLVFGNENVKFFPKNISPFVGMNEISKENFDALHQLIDDERAVGIFLEKEITIPDEWENTRVFRVLQMVCEKALNNFIKPDYIVPLNQNNVAEMLDLTKLTNPGPFEKHTILFGHYEGIFRDNKLVAMVGQRMHPQPYAEISALCTHPDFVGNGYATQLLLSQMQRIQSNNEIPFLHVLPTNINAIKLYEKLGFVNRKEFNIYVLQKKNVLKPL